MKRTLYLLVGLVVCLSACDNTQGDMYDPEWVREQYENQWKMNFGEIDPNQNFNMAKPVKANLSIREDALSEYTFKIYTANPLYDDNALLMAKKTVTTDADGFAETTVTFDAQLGQEKFYVVRVDNHNRRLLKSVKAADGALDVSFGVVGARSRAMEEGNLPTMDAPYTEAEVNQMIAEGYDLSKGLEYTAAWGNQTTIGGFDELPLITNNGNASLIAVVTTEFNLFSTQVGDKCYVPGEPNYGWKDGLPDQLLGYHTAEKNINPGDVKMIITKGGVYRHNKGNVTNMDIIVASGGVLEIESNVNMWENSRLIVMPGGKVVDYSTSGYSINNDAASSLVYIAGTMENIRHYLLNSGDTYIAETGVFTGQQISFVNGDCVLTNWGKVDVDIIGFTDNNNRMGTLNNGCLLRSKERIQVGTLNQNANTAVECNLILVDYVTLRNNSILRAETLDIGSAEAIIKYVGTSETSALVSADQINLNAGSIEISGHVYVETNGFNGEYAAGVFDNAIADAYGVALVGESNFAIFPAYEGNDLTQSECTGRGNIPNDYGPTVDDEVQTWRVACEDLGSIGDYDFNDIVFDVAYVAGESTATITAQAAGGTLAAYLCHETAGQIGEIHWMFEFDDITLMINTGVDHEWGGRNNFKGKTISIPVSTDFSMANNMGGFYLEIVNGDKKVNTTVGPKAAGETPQMICVPSDWRWPTETVNIGVAYPDFGAWGSNYGNDSWYKTAIADYIY